MAKYVVEIYKGYSIGHWVGDNTYFIYEGHVENPRAGQNILDIKKSLKASQTCIDKIAK